MILWTNKVKLATLVLLAVTPSLAHAQIADEVVSNAPDTGYLTSEVASPDIEVGQPGEYFEQSADCGCLQNSCDPQQTSCGRQCGNGLGLRGIARALRPFGDTSGYESYRSIFGGWSEGDGDFDNGSGGPILPFEFNDGFVLGTAKGIYLNSNTRVEREFSWRNNSAERVNELVPPLELDGRMNTFSSMVNVIREFRPNSRIKPYLGVGIGASRQDGEFSVDGLDLELDDWAFAYQGIAGLKFKKSCRTSLFVEYRYLGNTETNLEASTLGLPSTDIGDFDYTAENVVFGIQFKR